MLEIVGGIVDVLLKVVGVEGFQVIVLEQLDPIFLIVHLDRRNEDLPLHLAIERWPDPHHYSHIVVALHLALLHALNLILNLI